MEPHDTPDENSKYASDASQTAWMDEAQKLQICEPLSEPAWYADLRTYRDTLRRFITNDLLKAAGFSDSGFKRRIMQSLLYLPGQRVAQLAAAFDQEVATLGFQKAVYNHLARYVRGYEIHGVENIPREGPLLIVANHPGTVDAPSVIANIPRDDLKVTVVGDPIFHQMVASSKHLICIPRANDRYGRMEAIREIIRHLMQGGSLLMFPTGAIDPDPSVLPGAQDALEKWSPSVELILRKVPQTRLLITIISGVLSPRAVNHPLTRLFNKWETAKVAGVIQIMIQSFFPDRYHITPNITFGPALTLDDFREIIGPILDEDPHLLLSTIIEQARLLMSDHTMSLIGPGENAPQLITYR